MSLAFWNCSDNTSDFPVDPTVMQEGVRFEKRPGGAMMYYKLPDNSDIFGINVRYKDARDFDILKTGGYAGDSLLLDGFNEAREGITAQLTLVDNNNNESSPIEVTFSTEDSAPYTFLNSVNVESSWNGFQLSYQSPEVVTGMAHVFYLGTNPTNHQPDTILVRSFPIAEHGDTIVFSLKQARDKNTVIVRSEDYRGYRVGQRVWEDLLSYTPEKFPLTADNFECASSMESETSKAGKSYLFDGDTKGIEKFTYGDFYGEQLYTFVGNAGTAGDTPTPMYVDLGEPKVIASVRMYAMLAMNQVFAGNVNLAFYDALLPCDVSVYGSNNKAADEWVFLGSYKEEPSTPYDDRWSYGCMSDTYMNPVVSVEQFAERDSIYLEVGIPASEQEYQYLKIVINDTFFMDNVWMGGIVDYNTAGFVSFSELEVYVKKEDL